MDMYLIFLGILGWNELRSDFWMDWMIMYNWMCYLLDWIIVWMIDFWFNRVVGCLVLVIMSGWLWCWNLVGPVLVACASCFVSSWTGLFFLDVMVFSLVLSGSYGWTAWTCPGLSCLLKNSLLIWTCCYCLDSGLLLACLDWTLCWLVAVLVGAVLMVAIVLSCFPLDCGLDVGVLACPLLVLLGVPFWMVFSSGGGCSWRLNLVWTSVILACCGSHLLGYCDFCLVPLWCLLWAEIAYGLLPCCALGLFLVVENGWFICWYFWLICPICPDGGLYSFTLNMSGILVYGSSLVMLSIYLVMNLVMDLDMCLVVEGTVLHCCGWSGKLVLGMVLWVWSLCYCGLAFWFFLVFSDWIMLFCLCMVSVLMELSSIGSSDLAHLCSLGPSVSSGLSCWCSVLDGLPSSLPHHPSRDSLLVCTLIPCSWN